MAQHNFVMEYDSVAKNWSWNVQTEHAVFVGKTIYIPETNEWVKPSETELLVNMDNQLADEIGSAVDYLNRRIEQWV